MGVVFLLFIKFHFVNLKLLKLKDVFFDVLLCLLRGVPISDVMLRHNEGNILVALFLHEIRYSSHFHVVAIIFTDVQS